MKRMTLPIFTGILSIACFALAINGIIYFYTLDAQLANRAMTICSSCRPSEFAINYVSMGGRSRKIITFKSFEYRVFNLTLDKGVYLTRMDVEAPYTLHNQPEIRTNNAKLYFDTPPF